jgi:hypothetical protein
VGRQGFHAEVWWENVHLGDREGDVKIPLKMNVWRYAVVI